jgi:hypothetical protein
MSFNGSGTFLINTAGQPVVSGTVISSTAFNALTADLATGLSTCLTKDGQTTPTANIPMGSNKITGLAVGTDATDAATLGQVQSTAAKLIGSVSGTDTITGTLSPTLTSYVAGQMFYFVAAGDNTGAVTLNINGLGAKNVTKNGSTALAAGELKSGQTVAVIYDGTRFQTLNAVSSALTGITTTSVTALGVNAGDSVTSGTNTTAVGYNAGTAITTGSWNTIVGSTSGNAITSGYSNSTLGYNTLRNVTSGTENTALGDSAYVSGNYSNSTCLGAGTAVTGNSQVQLGSAVTTTYAYGAVQDRSDERDKADIQDTNLGLNFIMQLKPRMFRWDMREFYKPPMPAANASQEEWAAYSEACKLDNLTHDGTKKRNRFHQGLIAQEVKATMDEMGVDFGGYQDHKINGGQDVLSLGYEEMIAPLIKAIQELKAEFDAYKATHP